MLGMKVSLSIPERDVAFMDQWAVTHNAPSRSAVALAAVRLLRRAELARDYEAAIADWYETGDADAWEATVADGLNDEIAE